MVEVSVVIVNYNGMRFQDILYRCLESVQSALSGLDGEIIFVDNDSHDASVEFVKSQFPSVIVVQNSENLGFAGGNNVGYAFATGDYILLINNDAIVDEDWASELVKALKNDPSLAEVGSVGPGIPKGTMSVMGGNYEYPNIDDPFYISGCSLAVRRRHVEQLFDEDYFCYHEDVWLSWLLRLQGRRIKRVSASRVYHYGSQTVKSMNLHSAMHFYSERNRLLNILTFYSVSTLLRLVPLLVVTMLANANPKSYMWLFRHVRTVLKKRRCIQRGRRVDDDALTKFMSSRISNHNDLLNKVSHSYLKLVGIRTVEIP
jgi:GT2 family glycosyltransferase